MQADALDGSSINNANIWVPTDGSSPRMQMFRWTFTTPNRDAALDSSIVAHEYGHGVSIRLTGGSSNGMCLTRPEQMGEGYSDLHALFITTVVSDTGLTPRPIAPYVVGHPQNGPGIRRYPYSTDMTVNPLTYDDIKTAVSEYDVGEVWVAMVWEVYWGLVDDYGFDPDLYHGTGGNNLTMQLVMDSLKLQPCGSGFVDARDAILLADQINNGGVNQCRIWQGFAKRGLGYSADQGSAGSITDGVEAFDLPPECTNKLILTKSTGTTRTSLGEVLTYTVTAQNWTTGDLTGIIITDIVPAGTTYIPNSASHDGSESNGIVQWDIGLLPANTVIIRTFQVTVDDSAITGGKITNTAYITSAEGISATATSVIPAPIGCNFFDDFESGQIGSHWDTLSASVGDVWVSSWYPIAGNYSAALGATSIYEYDSYAALILPIDLTGQGNVELDFWWDDRQAADDPEHGVFISDDSGATWHKVFAFDGWGGVRHDIIDIDAQAAANGLALNNQFQIKFQFYGYIYNLYQAYVIDDVRVNCRNLSITKTVKLTNNPVQRGDPITYTIVISNTADFDISNVTITDTLPAYLNGVDLDQIVTVTAGKSLTFTVPATVDLSVPYGEVITNTAYILHVSESNQASAVLIIQPHNVHLPIILKER